MTSGGGSGSRAAAGAVRIGHAIGAALTNRRVLSPIEARLSTVSGLLLCGLSVLFALFPAVLVYPVVALSAWFGIALLCNGYRLHRRRKKGGGPGKPLS
jgi:cardiolipin synthase A/B